MAAICTLFDAMLGQGASDLHISPGYPPMIRTKGELVPMSQQAPLTAADTQRILFEILSTEEKDAFVEERDLDFAYDYGTKARFRGNYFYKTSGIGGVFRTIPSTILSLEQLKTPPAIRKLAEKHDGLILVTGPTGSGKSTTLAAMLDYINTNRAQHILTVEDPVEFVHQPKQCIITHREVGRDIRSFPEAIRAAGRENADVVLIGELRGAETMGLALQMASAGVLVFATIHTNSSVATIDRYVNAFPSSQQSAIRSMLAECLTGIVSQQLLRKADGSGRLAAHEILISNRAVGTAIRDSKNSMISSLIQSGRKEGMQTMDANLEDLVKQGLITPTDALEKAIDKESFRTNPMIQAALSSSVV